jgi:crossover junction endodeoxyribonuclease RuvC
LLAIHEGLTALFRSCRPDCVAVENLFFARNVRSALKLGHARGVVILAAVEAGLPVIEYTPAEIKRAIVGYGRAEKHQVGEMVRLLLGLEHAPLPHDASDALAVAICHTHSAGSRAWATKAAPRGKIPRSWRQYRPTGPDA